MSANTYFTPASEGRSVSRLYKTSNPKTRRLLVKHGWVKQRRDDLDHRLGRNTMATVMAGPEGNWFVLGELKYQGVGIIDAT